jgi:positive regulator of sigma E activity
MLGRSQREFDSEPGSIPVGAIVETGTAWGVLLPGSLLFYFCPLILRVVLLVFPLVSAAIDDENYLKFKWLCDWSTTGQGRRAGLRHLSSGVVSVAQIQSVASSCDSRRRLCASDPRRDAPLRWSPDG